MKTHGGSSDGAARDFVDRVAAKLGDVPRPQRDELTAELQRHLHDVRQRSGSISELGSAEDYARDLREAMGLAAQSKRRPAAAVLTVAAILIAATVTTVALSHQPRSTPTTTSAGTVAQSDTTPAPSFVAFSFGRLCGQQASAAEEPTVSFGGAVIEHAVHSTAPKGTIVSTDPACGTAIPLNGTLTINVSR